MLKLLLNPADNLKLRPQPEVDKLIQCFADHGIITTQQQVILLWERISREVYGIDWVPVDVSQPKERLWLILQGNRFLWGVENYD